MREELEDILNYLNAPFLTNAEWVLATTVLNGRSDNKSMYQALHAVLCERGDGNSDVMEGLHNYFRARKLTPDDLTTKPFSNIFIGAPLE